MNPAGGLVVYASWNGATELDTWTVLAGTTAGALAKAGSQRWADFEAAITVNTREVGRTGLSYCPGQAGLRFSTKAAMPSRRSADSSAVR